MRFLLIKASELQLDDIVGEGQEIWCIQDNKDGIIQAWWGPAPGNDDSIGERLQDLTHKKVWGENDLIKVLRRTYIEHKGQNVET